MTKEELIKLNYAQKIAIANVVIEMGKQRSFGLDGSELSELYNRAKEVQSLFYYESLKADSDSKVLHQASLKLSHLLSRFMPIGPIEITESFVVPVGKVKEAPVPSNKLKTPYISIQSVTSSSISLSWTSVENAAVYELQRALDPNFTQGVVMLQSDSNLSFVDTGLEPDTRYYYNLKAKNPPDFRDSNFAFVNAKTSVFVPSVNIYYGWSDTNSLPTIEEIASSDFITILPGANYLLPFQEVQDWKYLWFWEPLTEPIKTDWEEPGNPLNKGQIGGSTNLFRSPKEIGEGRWFITAYQTIADAALLLKSGGEVIPDDPDHEWTTATPPVVTGNDTTNILTATHSEYQGEIVVSVNGGSYIPYTGPINVGDNDRPVGYWKFKVRENAEEYRHESSVVNSPEFHKIPEVAKYTLTVNVNGTTGATIYVNGSPIAGNSLTVDAGTVLNNIIVIKSGFTIDPPSVSSITMDSDKTLTFTATPIPVFRTLTIVVNGLSEPYKIFIDGIEQESNVLTFPDGTILDDIYIQIDNHTVTPASIPSLVMDQNRTATFTATPVKRTLTIDTGGIEGVDIYIDEVLHTGPLVFDHGTVLSNISPHKAGYSFEPTNVPSLIMDSDQTLTFVGTAVPKRILTINVEGVDDYILTIDGAVKTGTEFLYNDGETVNNIEVSKDGWKFAPPAYPSTLMDGDKTLTFIAEEIQKYTLTINVTGATGYEVRINGALQPSGILSFPEGTPLNNIVLTKAGFVFSPPEVSLLIMDADKVLNFTATEKDIKVIFVGDSIIRDDGWADVTFSKLGIPYTNHWTGNETAQDFLNNFGSKTALINDLTSGEYTHIIVGHGFADINTTDATITKNNIDSVFDILAPYGQIIYKTTISPSSASTDQWATALNQSIPNEPSWNSWSTRRKALNALIRNDSKFHGIIDLAAEMEVDNTNTLVENGGFILSNGVSDWPTSDGIHLNEGLVEVISDTIQPQILDLLGITIVTPTPPVLISDDILNTLSATHELGISEILVSVNNGIYTQYTGTISVGDVNRVSGYWKFKIKSAPGRKESAVVSSPEFKKADVIPAAPVNDVVDDINKTFNWTNNPEYANIGDYEFTLDGGTTYDIVTSKPIVVGPISKPIGQVGVRVRAVEGRAYSDTLFNTSPFTSDIITPNLLPDGSFIDLPLEYFNETSTEHIFESNLPWPGVDILLDKKMDGDGRLAFKTRFEGLNCSLYLCNNSDINNVTEYIIIAVDGSNYTVTTTSQSSISYNGIIEPGDFFILTKEDDLYRIEKSSDGIIIEDVTLDGLVPPAGACIYIGVSSASTIMYPQGKGLTDL